MSYAQDNGYTPATFETLMSDIRVEINAQFGTSYTAENFVGTNHYKYFYALVQKVLENETKTAEIFTKLQEYIATTNARIQRPSVSLPGIVESFESQGYVAAVDPVTEETAGTISICVDVDPDADDYDDTKLEICNLVKTYVVGGTISMGTEVETIALSNGQSFDFKFFLPDETQILLRLTLDVSANTLITVPDDETIRAAVFAAINARYKLGLNFEPQRYFTHDDAPYAASILLEWSDNAGADWHDEVFVAAFDDLFTFDLGDIEIVVNT